MGELLGVIGGCIIIVVLFFAGVNHLNAISCESQWKESGMQSQYSFFGGCQVKLPNNTWIPAKNYRDID